MTINPDEISLQHRRVLECPKCGERCANQVLLGRHAQRYHAEDSDSCISEPDLVLIPPADALLPLDIVTNPDLLTGEGAQGDHYADHDDENIQELGQSQDLLNLHSNPLSQPFVASCNSTEQPSIEGNNAAVEPLPPLSLGSAESESGNVAFQVIDFFNHFDDRSEELYPGLTDLKPALEILTAAAKKVIQYCMDNQLPLGEAGGLFSLISNLEMLNPEAHRPVSSQFRDDKSFCNYINKARKVTVKREGWRRAVIETSFGVNRTGVFRCPLQLLLKTIGKVGGTDAIIPFREQHRRGERVFSAPWNAEAMGQYQRCLKVEGCLVLMDLYSDGTTLSSSGTQSANNMRIRFANLRGETDIWHDIGIVPCVDTAGERKSDPAIRQEKTSLLQRFNYLVLKDSIRVSHTGSLLNGIVLYPRIGVNVFDQPQERAEVSLKDHNSFRDCTPCLMPTKLKKAQAGHELEKRLGKRMKSGDRLTADTQRPFGNAESVDLEGEVLKIQLGQTPFQRRNVYATVRRQVLVAGRKHHPSVSKYHIDDEYATSEAKRYLENVSALAFPPALAAFDGMGSTPHRLYASVGFDKLHVIEHGILRMVPDDAYKVFDTARQYNGWSKGDVVKIANQRLLDLPRSAQLPSFQPFRKNVGEKQAGVTGKMRRDLAPFLWYALMGIPRNTPPDEDPLVQVLLMIDNMQQNLLGINRPPEFANRSSAELQKLGELCFEVGQLTTITLGTFVTTKLHRIMRHTSDHFRDNGCIRKGATDQNETLHKATKKAYRATNKHLLNIAPQLLKARIKIEHARVAPGNSSDAISTELQLLITRNPLVKLLCDETPVDENDKVYGNVHTERISSQTQSFVARNMSPQEAERSVKAYLHPSSNHRVWEQMKSVRFQAQLPWMPGKKVWQTVYAGDKVFRTDNRRDAVVYNYSGQNTFGFIQAIFKHRASAHQQYALVRRLREVTADDGNRNVVEKYGNRRFAYVPLSADIQLDFVPCTTFIRSAMLVPDAWMVANRYGPKQRMNFIPDDRNARRCMRFFEICGFKYSSLAEAKLM